MRSRLPTAVATDAGITKCPISGSSPLLSRSGLSFGVPDTEVFSVEKVIHLAVCNSGAPSKNS